MTGWLLPFLALAAQPAASPDGVERLACRVVAVSGATVDFRVELKGDSNTGEARISRPGAAFVPASERKFLIHDLPNSLLLRLVPLSREPGRYVTTLFLEVGGRAGFPVAGGYCDEAGPKGTMATAASFGALTDAALQKAAEDHLRCFLLTPKGEVSRFHSYLVERGPAWDRVFEPLDRTIWPDKRASSDQALPSPPPEGVVPVEAFSIFNGGDASPNPTGLAVAYFDPARALAVQTFEFTRLGRSEASSGDRAFGICAIRMKGGG